jgi:hypothetical protein
MKLVKDPEQLEKAKNKVTDEKSGRGSKNNYRMDRRKP